MSVTPPPHEASHHSLVHDLTSSIATTVAEMKPRLRGWLHAYAAGISIVTGIVLIAVTAATKSRTAGISVSIYAATVTMLFGTSALYHRLNWSDRARKIMKQLDHSMIFIFIAGSYTPMAALLLPHDKAVTILLVVWIGALFGVVLQTVWPQAPRWLSAPCYLALGWVAIFILPDLLHTAGVAALVLIATGGVLYSIGAIVYATKKPDPWPGTFGFHEVFHLCTILAAVCHYIAIWFAVFR